MTFFESFRDYRSFRQTWVITSGVEEILATIKSHYGSCYYICHERDIHHKSRGFQVTSTTFMQQNASLGCCKKAMSEEGIVVKIRWHCGLKSTCVLGRNRKLFSLYRLGLLPCSLASGSLERQQ